MMFTKHKEKKPKQVSRGAKVKSCLINTNAGSIAFGLEWRAMLSNTPLKDELAQYRKETGAKSYIEHQNSKGYDEVLGFCSYPSSKNARIYSGASYFARVIKKENAVLLLKSDETYFMCVIRGYAPLNEYDCYGNLDFIEERIQSFIRLIGDAPYITIVDDSFDSPNSLSELLAVTNMSIFDEVIPEAMLLPSYEAPLGTILFFAGVTIVLLAGIAWNSYAQMQKQKRLEEERLKQPTPLDLYKQSRDVEYVNRNKEQVADLVDLLKAQIRQFKFNSAGWKLENINCQVNICTLKWGIHTGTYQTFVEAHDKSNVILMPPGGDLTRLDQKYPLALGKFDKAPAIDLLPKHQDWLLQIGTLFQDLKLAGLQPAIEAPRLAGSYPNGPTDFPERLMMGNWTLTGDYALLDDLRLSEGIRKFTANMTFVGLSISLAKDTTQDKFQLSGEYWVR